MSFDYRDKDQLFSSLRSMTSLMNRQANSLDILSDALPKILERLETRAILNEHGVNNMGDISDGYHTFNELYYHRMILFSVIVSQNRAISWKSKKHSDNTMYDDMFIVGINTPMGQVTYHYNLKYWNYFDCCELKKAPEYDGHTSDDVCNRLLNMIGKYND